MFNNFVFILTKVANHAQYKVEDSCTKETPSLAEIVMDVSEGYVTLMDVLEVHVTLPTFLHHHP